MGACGALGPFGVAPAPWLHLHRPPRTHPRHQPPARPPRPSLCLARRLASRSTGHLISHLISRLTSHLARRTRLGGSLAGEPGAQHGSGLPNSQRPASGQRPCVCACACGHVRARACVHVCVRACVRVGAWLRVLVCAARQPGPVAGIRCMFRTVTQTDRHRKTKMWRKRGGMQREGGGSRVFGGHTVHRQSSHLSV